MEFDLQEVFDTVATHLIKQGERSASYTECLYKDGLGRSCAIGCLIKDKYYSRDLEGKKAIQGQVVNALAKSLNTTPENIWDNSGSLLALQSIHDDSMPEEWNKKLKDFAMNRSLALPDVLLKP